MLAGAGVGFHEYRFHDALCPRIYSAAPGPKSAKNGDHGGFEFPGTAEPDYWDFLYFSFTAGMSFAASDVNVTRGRVRRIVVLQCLLSFIFNIGVLAFSINVLAGAAA